MPSAERVQLQRKLSDWSFGKVTNQTDSSEKFAEKTNFFNVVAQRFRRFFPCLFTYLRYAAGKLNIAD
jgi:hypothetical protein